MNEMKGDWYSIWQALVTIGDKEANFVGSRKWIGSSEVGFVLDQLYEVSAGDILDILI